MSPAPTLPCRATVAAAAASAVILMGCALPRPASAPVLEDTPWHLVALRGQALPALPLAAVPQLELKAGRVAGTSGCNRIAGSYTLAGSALQFGPTAGTRMLCPSGMELEREVLAVLPQVARWRWQDGQLELLDAAGTPLARLASNLRSYQCGDQGTVHVLYTGQGADAGARLSLAGREYTMRAAPVASGARYVVEQGRQTDMSMEWRTKGDEAQLLEAPLSDSRKPEDLKAFASCRAR